ncbi:hypothetical protein A2690_00050 [Candidatus Roizmanbacteria bacterium RIFCSPHIGHO2_01_FULL_39_12b]|uniref:Metallo-beta-lactamase domain-containing protein n=1 Tax=Candidatus Roizmanbacteria bacterium RIFCSPHIGHO2_01_FULL_39_12b TaxID=1802030 RepID=A0A1F7GDH4_9BACT|nr:MAG: hypothetical protein A2690_00050 [Candidatus Roizmanbacteria bacterium RIFCSPHIGHO2_01_FULL_39_12b]
MKIHTYSLGQMLANCYLIENGVGCLVIDPGDSADFILGEVQKMRLKCLGLFATHGHFDHIMAVGELQLSINVAFYINEKDLFLVERLNETAKYFLGYDPGILPPQKVEFLTSNNLLLDTFNFKILHTPGHTPGSCCFYFEKEKMIFTGDTLFKEGIGRYDHSYSDKEMLFKSLKTLFKLPENTKIYPGHGESSTISKEWGDYV